MSKYVIAIDHGTTSTRAVIFDHAGQVVSLAQLPHDQILPKPGWVEHNPVQVWKNTQEVIATAMIHGGIKASDIAAAGIATQRMTVLIWDRHTGVPVYNAIVWQDSRVEQYPVMLDEDVATGFKLRLGLPEGAPMSIHRATWILDNVSGAREAAERGDLMLGTMDTWLAWKLTGGTQGGVHVTDVTCATQNWLMDVDTMEWMPDFAEIMRVPIGMLPEIRSSSELYGYGREGGVLPGVPLTGILGDQQAALFGQACFTPGSAKSTYGTGNFLLMNTGAQRHASRHGLLSTIGYKIGEAPAVYALEGSAAVTGSLIQWLRDNLVMFSDAEDVEWLARKVPDNGGAYFVPAFSGLYAPYWRPDARGAIVGLTRFVNRSHIARAALEAVAYQTRELIDIMHADSGVDLAELKVDGGMTANETLMQFQADMLGVDVVRPVLAESTALGAAYAAGIAVGYWDGEADIVNNWAEGRRWRPEMAEADTERLYGDWKKAVTRTFGWVDVEQKEN
ncbi:glycerol kinase GlpK [Streptomyces sp. SHP 1-2]|nr:glycerol kinase GlpK [Streptomyces sp. SHP 1-2]MCW5253093.1 glycerol kinase GlpK [Streptomyces sp. SHP 1-2]